MRRQPTAAPPSRRPGRRAIRLASIGFLLAVHAAGCTEDTPDGSDFSVDCAVIDESSITASLGVSAVEVSDESTDSGGTAQLLCRYTPTEPGSPTIVIRAAQETTSGQAARDVASAEASCDGPQDVDLEDVTGFVCPEGDLGGGPQAYATWDGLDVRVALTETRDPADDAGAVLGEVTAQVRESLDRESFGRS